jgi:hypothetical protein
MTQPSTAVNALRSGQLPNDRAEPPATQPRLDRGEEPIGSSDLLSRAKRPRPHT